MTSTPLSHRIATRDMLGSRPPCQAHEDKHNHEQAQLRNTYALFKDDLRHMIRLEGKMQRKKSLVSHLVREIFNTGHKFLILHM